MFPTSSFDIKPFLLSGYPQFEDLTLIKQLLSSENLLKMPIVGKDTPKTVSIPTATLRKFSGSRVDPYTRYVAYMLFKDLNISISGQRNINNALSNLPVHLSIAPDEKLSFGWSLSNVIRDKAVHEGSYEHLAMMIALGESESP